MKGILLFLVGVLIVGGYYYYSRNFTDNTPKITTLPTPSTVSAEVKGAFDKFLPSTGDKITLNDKTTKNLTGMAWRSSKDNKFKSTVIADLDSPENGSFYQAWLIKNGEKISLGELTQGKGGWITEFESSKDYSEYSKVQVTQEKRNGSGSTLLLEGSF